MNAFADEVELNDRLALWRMWLRRLCYHVKVSIQPLLDAPREGEQRSPRVVPRGPEPEVPRPLTLDDDLAWLDHRRVEALAQMPFAVALANGLLRTVPARREVTGECVTLVDLSRSMLSGCLADPLSTGGSAAAILASKIAISLCAAASVQAAAGGAQFALRAVLLRRGGGVADVLKSPRPQGFSVRVIDQMQNHYVELFRSAQPPHGECPEPQTSIRQGLHHVLREVRGKGLVVIVSDFLEPFASWRGVLLEVMARHRVLLLDVSAELDVRWPETAVNPDLVLEGARHLEDAIFERDNRLADIRAWNEAARTNLAAIDGLIRGRAVRQVLRGHSFVSIYRRIRGAVRSLR